jgi:hypothetical protein
MNSAWNLSSAALTSTLKGIQTSEKDGSYLGAFNSPLRIQNADAHFHKCKYSDLALSFKFGKYTMIRFLAEFSTK